MLDEDIDEDIIVSSKVSKPLQDLTHSKQYHAKDNSANQQYKDDNIKDKTSERSRNFELDEENIDNVINDLGKTEELNDSSESDSDD